MQSSDSPIKILEHMINIEYQLRCQEIENDVSENMILTILSLYTYFMRHEYCMKHISTRVLLEIFSLASKVNNSEKSKFLTVQNDISNRLKTLNFRSILEVKQCH